MQHDLSLDTFEPLGGRDPRSLRAARLVLHWAAQIPSAAGETLIEPRPDHSQAALSWLDGQEAMASEPLPGDLRAALRPRDLALLVLDPRGRVVAERGLAGATLAEALGWLRSALSERLGRDVGPLRAPEHELPPHPVGAGAAFEAAYAPERAELARWFAAAARLTAAVAARHAEAGPARLWPHHFDLATLLVLDPGEDPEEARSVGVGLSPGDAGIDEPYVYVTPWPAPAPDALPALAGGGAWTTEGWTGAVLRGDDLARSDGAEQRERLAAFAASAIAASRALLDA